MLLMAARARVCVCVCVCVCHVPHCTHLVRADDDVPSGFIPHTQFDWGSVTSFRTVTSLCDDTVWGPSRVLDSDTVRYARRSKEIITRRQVPMHSGCSSA